MAKTIEFKSDLISSFYDYMEKPQQKDFNMHAHQMCEICYLMSGKGIFHIEGNDYILQKGDILIMDCSESHYIEVNPNYPYERFIIHFKKEIIEKIDPERKLLEPFENRTPGKNNLFRRENFGNKLYDMLMKNIILATPDNRLKLEVNFFALLNELSTAFSNMDFKEPTAGDTQINKITNYILDNIEKPFTLDNICDECFISKGQLCKIFKQSMGSTVWNYVTVKRLILAKEMLDSGELPTKIYSKCGFSDYSVFFRAYKKHFGKAPTSARQK